MIPECSGKKAVMLQGVGRGRYHPTPSTDLEGL